MRTGVALELSLGEWLISVPVGRGQSCGAEKGGASPALVIIPWVTSAPWDTSVPWDSSHSAAWTGFTLPFVMLLSIIQ